MVIKTLVTGAGNLQLKATLSRNWHFLVIYCPSQFEHVCVCTYTCDLLISSPEQIAQKYDPQKEEELRIWIEDITGKSIGPDFQKGMKDGVILCE